MKKQVFGLTLIELMIGLVLFSLIIIGFSNIDIFSRHQVTTSVRRSQLQNEIAFILQHMERNVSKAIGNEVITVSPYGVGNTIRVVNNPNDVTLRAYIDANRNAMRDADINNAAATQDHWIIYRWDATGGSANYLRYCGRCRNDTCNLNQCNETVEVLSNRVTDFRVVKPGDPGALSENYVEISNNGRAGITLCWDPNETAHPCGTSDNPQVNARSTIRLPSVSVR